MKGEQIVRYLGIAVLLAIGVWLVEYWMLTTERYVDFLGVTWGKFVDHIPIVGARYHLGRLLPLFPLVGLAIGLLSRGRRLALAELFLQLGCILTALLILLSIVMHEKMHRDTHWQLWQSTHPAQTTK